ncbi:hypothetical protein [Spirosoma flavum]|uniref:Transposase n=1 Tax=Spirosoma flavum TaxID=2048557 RepID=A0ABW6AHR5_9BACT
MKGESQIYYQLVRWCGKVAEGKNNMLVLNAVRNNGAARAANSLGLLGNPSRSEI